ncbi:MAG: tetratricopeptide repeat protein [Desulfuromusa sp.]|jgi:tetratricopeptide (TPR) repeat protein|nr:tetratricopeptide repeat protein [Desulfuromusa sp.]
MRNNNVHQLAAWGLFIAIVGGYFFMAVKFPLAYIVATYEDLVGEWAQVYLFAATMLLSIRVACFKSRFRFFFAFLALACFYVVGEEISWGQRIFNLMTPDFFEKHNLQNETNLHNFFTGPMTTTLKRSLEYLIALGLVGYGLLYPLLVSARLKLALWFNKKGLPHPPLYLWPFFVVSAYLELGFISFNEAEIAEILIPLALAIMAINYLLAMQKYQGFISFPKWQKTESIRLASQSAALVLSVIMLAFATTGASYSSSTMGPKIESRYYNGLEKFANRYKRIEHWDSAANLYLLVHEKKSGQATVLRNLYVCYSNMNDETLALSFLKKAEQLEIDSLAKDPLSVASHLSLVNTYEMIGDKESAADHLRGSLEIARLRVSMYPESAVTAYWLGKAEEMSGYLISALQEYQRALELDPGALKYQKAVLKLSRQLTANY